MLLLQVLHAFSMSVQSSSHMDKNHAKIHMHILLYKQKVSFFYLLPFFYAQCTALLSLHMNSTINVKYYIYTVGNINFIIN